MVKIQTNIAAADQPVMDQALRNSELRYRRLFEAAQDGIHQVHPSSG